MLDRFRRVIPSITMALVLMGTAACASKVVTLVPEPVTAAPDIAEHRLEYEDGLRAFNEFTPKGYSRAISHFARALALNPNSCEYALQLSQANIFLAFEQRSNYEDFGPSLQAAAPPDCALGTAFSLRLEALAGDFAPRRDASLLIKIDQAAALDSKDALNWFARWRLNPSSLDNSLLKAVELSPDLAVLQYELGNYRLITREYVEARSAFEKALELSPEHFRSIIGLAQAISAIDDEADVIPLYEKAVELAPDFVEGRVLLGDYYSGIEEIELARRQYLASIELNPRLEISHLRLGLTYLSAPDYDEAERSFRNAIQINPSSYEAFYYIGNIWLARGELTRARESYQESLKFVLNFPEALYALGVVYFRVGDIDLALEQFEKVLRINRNHADAYFSRAAVWSQRNLYGQAINDYNRALGLYEPQLIDLTDSIVQFEERGLTRKAEAERKRKERLEGIIERTRQQKMAAEYAWIEGSQ